MPTEDIIKELLILVGLALITAFAVNAFSPEGIALFGDWDTSKGVITAKPKNDIVNHQLEIGDIPTAKELYDNGALFVDARPDEEYKKGHIKGAASLPVQQFQTRINEFKNNFPSDITIVTYCSGRECDDSHMLADYLLDKGFTDIRVFIDGYPAWKKEGYPIER